ncbi:hypothetical protein NW768_009407 [Fusarium equiseti]|uniref:Uncharacterized protein n=1 Tax=Fusarium equiseti TaxID=61235 RepID=A0ABQ8R3C5_FUSEQ|nr:hypothetical protein NW768_009407 [Fusarium equiseti]
MSWIQHLPIVNVRASLRGPSAHLNKEYRYHILTLINFHRRRLRLRPALCITLLILPRARISITLLDPSNTLQLRRRRLTLRPRNRTTNPIVVIMSQSPILLFKSTTGRNTHTNIRNNTRISIRSSIRNNIRNNIRNSTHLRLCLRRRRIQRITHTRPTVQEILR